MAGAITGAGAIMGAGAIGACAKAGTAAPTIDTNAVVEIADSLVRVMVDFPSFAFVDELSREAYDADICPTSTHINRSIPIPCCCHVSALMRRG
jgi:hypothetical protein